MFHINPVQPYSFKVASNSKLQGYLPDICETRYKVCSIRFILST